jgi:hypothetical protein
MLDEGVLLRFPFCDTLYLLTREEKIIPMYNLNLNKPEAIQSFIQDNRDTPQKGFIQKTQASAIASVNDFADLDDWIYVTYAKNSMGYAALISKKDYSGKSFLSGDYVKERHKNIPFFISGYYENKLMAAIDGPVIRLYEKEDFEKFCSKLSDKKARNLIEEQKDTDNNPLICIVKIKERPE